MKVFNVSFKGQAVKLPKSTIRNANDAINRWELLKHPKFTNIFQESENATLNNIKINAEIRNNNYSFLEELKNTKEKAKFIEYFKNHTGFPYLHEISTKIIQEFDRVLNTVGKKIGFTNNDICISGYDKYCSVGLKTALPGSDLDKGFAIIKGKDGGLLQQKAYSNLIKEGIWNNIDNRLMSVNHVAAFPNIMTDKELQLMLNKIEEPSVNVIGTNERYNLFMKERLYNNNPVSAAKFNIWLSQLLNTKQEKEDIKNLAYIVEAIRDGATNKINQRHLYAILESLNNSSFAQCSNVIQGHSMSNRYDYNIEQTIKPKLNARKNIEKSFNSWNIDKQYELVKDIIRSMSGDNRNPEFKELFHSKTDTHRLLLNDILKGDVDCAFDFFADGGERIHIFPKTPEKIKKYTNFNIYQ